MPSEDVSPADVEPTSFEDVFELAADAREDGVRAKNRAEQQWFRYEDAGFVCLWEPQNRSGTKRISHWWVREERRDEGIGAALLDRAIHTAEDSNAERLDIYVYDPGPVEARGFEPAEGGQASTSSPDRDDGVVAQLCRACESGLEDCFGVTETTGL